MHNHLRSSVFPPPVTASFSLRTGGVSGGNFDLNLSYRVGDVPANVARNRAIFFGTLGVALDRIVTLRQVHGSRVVIATEPGEIEDADALVSDRPGLFLCVTVADCVPLLLYDPAHHAVAAVHAGWRGTEARIAEAAVRAMEADFGSRPAEILAHIGPAAGQCCYEVGADVAGRFSRQFVLDRGGRTFLDVKSANRQQLLECGLAPRNVQSSLFCTISDATHFHSHRRDGLRAGRMMGVIGLTA
jgi:YfiH family protein